MEEPLAIKQSPLSDTENFSERYASPVDSFVCQMCQRSMKIHPTMYDLRMSDIDKYFGE